MTGDLIGLAFGAGLVAALNPCGFALLPGYLALVVRQGEHSGRRSALGRAALATIAMTAGFVVVFGAFASLTVAAADTVQRHVPYATVVIGVVLTGIGLWLLAGRHLGLPIPDGLVGRWAPTARVGSMFGYGIAYAVASLSCTVGPFLAVTAAGSHSGSTARAATVLAAYGAGFMLIVAALALGAALASGAVLDRVRRIIPYVNRISGALLIVVGAYVSYYGLYEIRLFTGGGDPDDPVIAVAGRVQGAIAGWVHAHGAWPWIGVLGIAVAPVLIRRCVVTRRATRLRRDSATADGAAPPQWPRLPQRGR